jgi:hypothetical protein
VNGPHRKVALAAIVGGIVLATAGTAHAAVIDVAPATGTKTPANNDYQQIENAVSAANSDDVIRLAGTFDWTETNAAASWALGNDGNPGTDDDYSIVLPHDKSDVTITAPTPGGATIQGPGDLPNANLEGVFVGDGGGDNHGWEISNLRFLDFDLSIAFFNGAAGSDANDGVTIQDNFIRIPADLNATVAPADTNQNIGIHYSFGKDQTISGNTILFAGTGLTAGANTSSDVGMQSNTSGGDVYDGLRIEDNQLQVTGAQSASPERILGIWENGHAHLSDITVSGNSFSNAAAGNSPAQNLQRAFRVTSHSSGTSTVTYSNNDVSGANIGFEWLAGQDFSANAAVLLESNTITDAGTGLLIQSGGSANLHRNEITGSGAGGGVHVVNGALAGVGGGPAMFENRVTGGSADGVRVEADGAVFDDVSRNDLSGNAGAGFSNASTSFPAVNVSRNWWGSPDPAVVYPEIVQPPPGADPRPWLLSDTDQATGSIGFQGDVNRVAYDARSGAGDGSPDSLTVQRAALPNTFAIKQGATTVATGPFTEVRAYGSSDADTLTVSAASGPVTPEVGFLGRGGDDLAVVDDSTRSAGERYAVDPAAVLRSSAGDVSFDAATERVEVRGGSGADAFDVTPSPDTTFDVRGADPTTSPGDRLTYNDPSLSSTRSPAGGPDGQFTAPGVKPVVFTGMESVFLAVPGLPAQQTPAATTPQGGTETPQPSNPVTPPDTTRPVAASLRLSPSRIAKRGRRARPIPTLRYSLTEAASVQVVFERQVKGRRVGSRCSTTARTGKRCTVFRRALTMNAQGAQGANKLKLSSRVRTLPKGTYRLTLVATDAAGNKSAARRVTLTIVR